MKFLLILFLFSLSAYANEFIIRFPGKEPKIISLGEPFDVHISYKTPIEILDSDLKEIEDKVHLNTFYLGAFKKIDNLNFKTSMVFTDYLPERALVLELAGEKFLISFYNIRNPRKIEKDRKEKQVVLEQVQYTLEEGSTYNWVALVIFALLVISVMSFLLFKIIKKKKNKKLNKEKKKKILQILAEVKTREDCEKIVHYQDILNIFLDINYKETNLYRHLETCQYQKNWQGDELTKALIYKDELIEKVNEFGI